MFDVVLAWLYSPVPKIYLLLLAWVLWRMMRHIDKHIETVEAAKANADSDAWWAKKEDEPREYRQVYPRSVHKEWDRRRGEAEIAKFAHDWGFRALGRDRPYTVPAGSDAVFVRPEAWFAVLPEGAMSRHTLSAKQKSALQGATSWHDNAAIIGPIRATEHVDWPGDKLWSHDNWHHQESRDWDAQEDEAKAVKLVAEYAREWGFPFLHRGGKPPSWSEDECYWRAMPAGGILYKTTLVPSPPSGLTSLMRSRRQIACTAGSPPHRQQEP